MKEMLRILKLLVPYKNLAFLNMFFNLIQILAGLFSLALVMPLLDFMFNNNKRAISVSSGSTGMFNNLYADFISWMTETVGNNKQEALFWICIALLLATLIKNIARYMALYFLVILRNRVIQKIRGDVYHKVLALPVSYFSDERKGDILSRVSNDVREVEWSLMASLEAIFKEPATIVIFLGTLIFMSPSLTLYVALLLPVAAGSIALLGKSVRRKSKKNQEEQGAVLTFLEESLGGIKIIKSFVAEKIFGARFDQLNESSTRANIKVNHRGDLASPLSETMGIAVASLLLWIGGNMVFDAEITGSAFLAYFAIFSQVIPPFKQLSQAFPMVQRGAAGMDRYEEILKADLKIHEKEDARSLDEIHTGISYQNVSFSYTGKERVLDDVSFELPLNSKLALVGASGSGKSTLADLLPRFIDCSEGKILIDGVDIREFKLKDLRKHMGIVSQDPILFNDTIANNIKFGSEVSMEEVEEAARQANALEFIRESENGFDTVIGERGSKLSGGQKQRIAIARALIKKPKILILDEATSALDNQSEKLVQEALDNLKKGRTSLVIAHRLTTIQDSDEIIVLERGKVVERGSHKSLMDLRGNYFQLYNLYKENNAE